MYTRRRYSSLKMSKEFARRGTDQRSEYAFAGSIKAVLRITPPGTKAKATAPSPSGGSGSAWFLRRSARRPISRSRTTRSVRSCETMRDPIDLYNNTLVPMVVEQSNRGSLR
jgi:hypothetical protein